MSDVTRNGYVSVAEIISNVANGSASEPFQFRFVQQEHRGGFCDCWGVANLMLTHVSNSCSSELTITTSNYSNLCGVDMNYFHPTSRGLFEQTDSVAAYFCEDSASIPREFVAQFGGDITICDDPVIKDPPTNCSGSDLTL